jgi:Bacterial pre-peptidase C-terminal domain
VCGGQESHCYGRAWSGALWAIRGQLGATKADTLVLQSHFSQPADAGFFDAAQSLLAADRQLYAGADVPFLSTLLGQRNLLREPDNTPANAESLGVPGTAVDYADASSTYSDTDDVYGVTLQAGQTITARLAAGAGNFDLFLYRPGTTSVATTAGVLARSESPGGAERLVYTAPTAGRYFLDVYAKSGVSTYTVSTVNGDDAPPPPPPPPLRDTTAPTLSAYTIAPKRFRAARRGASVAARTSASVRYRLSEPATVRFGVSRSLPGRRIRGTCKRATKSNRKRGRRCTVFKTVPGSFTHASVAGLNRIRFTGRLRRRALSRRNYALTARATDAAGNRSKAKRVRFRIVR